MFPENIRRALILKGLGIPKLARHRSQYPPVRPNLRGQRQEGSLAGNAAFRIGDGAVFFAPAGRRQQNIGKSRGIRIRHTVRHDHRGATRQRLTNPRRIRQANRRIGTHDPEHLDVTAAHGLKQVNGLQPGRLRKAIRTPESGQPFAGARSIVFHMSGQGISQAPDFPPTHGIGLTGQRERAGARLAHTPRGQVAVDNGVALVSAGYRLINPLGKSCHSPGGVAVPAVKPFDVILVKIALGRNRRHRRRNLLCTKQRFRKTAAVFRNVTLICRFVLRQPHQQTIEQNRVRTRFQFKVQIRKLCGGGSAGINDHHPATGPLRSLHTLVENRVGPGGVAARQHQKIRELQVFITPGNTILAKRPFVGGHRRRHTQARVGVHVGCTNKTFGEFVGDEIILCQQLTRQVKGHRPRAVLSDRITNSAGHRSKGLWPASVLTSDPGL